MVSLKRLLINDIEIEEIQPGFAEEMKFLLMLSSPLALCTR